MKITDLVVTPIAFTDPPLLNAAGLHAPYALRIIIEVKTDENISGVGEIAGGSAALKSLEQAKNFIVGMDPFERNRIKIAIEKGFAGVKDTMNVGYAPKNIAKRVYSALNIALLDVCGKAVGKPVCDLIGGRVRDKVDFSAYLFYKYEGAGGEFGFGGHDPEATGWHKFKENQFLTPDEVVEEAKAMCSEFGFKSLKLKGGVFEPQVETDTVIALYKAFGEKIPVRIDPNACWTLETSIKYGKILEPYLEYYEDPCKGQEDMAELGRQVSIPRATNMCTTSFEEIPSDIRLGSDDIILADPHYWGGIEATMQLGKICSVFGRKLSMHSNSHLGISLMAMAHLGVACPEIDYAMDTHYPWQKDEVIKGGRIQFEDGALSVSNEPGLGVELDYDELERLHQNYLKCGYTERNDEIEMQKVVPDWKFSTHIF